MTSDDVSVSPEPLAAPITPATPVRTRARPRLHVLARHQVGSLVATLVDFGAMIAVVRFLGLTAVEGTCIGATCGAIANFTLGRLWIFESRAESARGQAVRYAFVSLASLGLNAFGEFLLHDCLRVQYVVARAIVAIVVSVGWNFTMQRVFVFRAERSK
jgi:putative flippase GtrA